MKLGRLGVTELEEAAYELLIDHSPATLPQLTTAWPRQETLPPVLSGLETKGLLVMLDGEPVRYTAVPPDVAFHDLLERERAQLARVRASAAELVALHREHLSDADAAVVEIIEGPDTVRRHLAQLFDSARDRLDSLLPVADGDLTTSLLGCLERGVECRSVRDRGGIDQPQTLADAELLTRAGEQARIALDVPLRLHLVDDRLAIVPLGGTELRAAYVVYPSGLLDAFAGLFGNVWRYALPFSPAAATDGELDRAARAAEREQRRLVALMLSGLTDERIAHHLGLGHRTVQRQVARLMSGFEARTRFQAGVQAALRDTRREGSEGVRPGH